MHAPAMQLPSFSSYLSNRQQCVVLEGHSSSPANISSGVPQGSILGPLLFILYMDSIHDVPLSQDSKLLLYANDILLYSPIRHPSDFTSIQSDVDSISQCVCQSGLRLNVAKTRFVLFSRQRHPLSTSLTLDGSPIPQVSSVKYLGVILSKDLTWNDHINSVCLDAKRRVGFLYRQFHLAGTPCLYQLYKSLVLPTLDYCSSVWIPAQHFIPINWSLYRTLPLKLLRNSGTLPMMIA